jgi:pyruvate/2-oxoglutarate dehydrogenase complex dihydrolipoamide acyltransferase (E2) component
VSEKMKNLTEYIKENFGANASYVEGLYDRFQSDPNLVDESWQKYFNDLVNGDASKTQGNGQSGAAVAKPQTVKAETPAREVIKAKTPAKEQKETKVGADVHATPLTGVSKVIVENMEESLTVPTATSVRRVPVKLLEENRKVINESMQSRSLGKVSFTHLIGWAIIKAAKEFPSMNNGFGVVDGKPSRLESKSINLGIAVDVEKKDGSRNLLVPNLKGVNEGTFWQFYQKYNETVTNARTGKLTLDDFQGDGFDSIPGGISGNVLRLTFAARYQQDHDHHKHLRSSCHTRCGKRSFPE